MFKMLRNVQIFLFMLAVIQVLIAAPVDPKKGAETKDKKETGDGDALDDIGLEYGRYLQQIVQTLEEDKEFAKKLENVSDEQIKSGKIAEELEFVKHNVRTKLDELKRMEVDRLRKLVQEQLERTELGLYRDEDGRLLPSPDGRRWRTISGRPGASENGGGDFWLGLDRKGVKIPQHLDIGNPHSFEISDLQKLIHSATKDLEELDKQRRDYFKKYELEKEAKYRESLKNMTDDQKKETEKHHEELVKKHKDHPKVHHPGSKPQLEQVWEDEDHMPKEEFNPKTFFAMHDVNEDGHLDVNEVEAILRPEVKKMYDPHNEEDDPTEMEEEYHRMREHVFNETDKDRDGLISLSEFIRMTQQRDFEQDEGWKGLDEQNVYSETELEEYMRQRQLEMSQQYYGDPRAYYDVPNAQHPGMPPNINYNGGHPGVPPQGQYHQPAYPQGHPPPQYQGVPPQQQQQQHYQGMPPQQQQQHYQGLPPQQHYQGVPPQQQQQHFQGVPPQQQQQHFQGVPQQQQQQHFQGVPPQQQQQQYQGVPPQQQQQQYQGVPPQQQQHQGMPQGVQQHQGMSQGVPPQHQGMSQGVPPQHQGIPQQQQYQAVPSQQHQAGQPQFQAPPQVQPGSLNNPPQQQPSQIKQNTPVQNSNQIPGEKSNVPSPNAIPQQQPKN